MLKSVWGPGCVSDTQTDTVDQQDRQRKLLWKTAEVFMGNSASYDIQQWQLGFWLTTSGLELPQDQTSAFALFLALARTPYCGSFEQRSPATNTQRTCQEVSCLVPWTPPGSWEFSSAHATCIFLYQFKCSTLSTRYFQIPVEAFEDNFSFSFHLPSSLPPFLPYWLHLSPTSFPPPLSFLLFPLFFCSSGVVGDTQVWFEFDIFLP